MIKQKIYSRFGYSKVIAVEKYHYMLETPKALSTLKGKGENINGCNNGQSTGNQQILEDSWILRD